MIASATTRNQSMAGSKSAGLKPEFRIALQAAPRGFRTTLGKLPPGAKFVRRLKDR